MKRTARYKRERELMFHYVENDAGVKVPCDIVESIIGIDRFKTSASKLKIRQAIYNNGMMIDSHEYNNELSKGVKVNKSMSKLAKALGKIFTIVGLLAALVAVILGIAGLERTQGEYVGYITSLKYSGYIFKTGEGVMNMTQTGNNSAGVQGFSIDRDQLRRNPDLYNKLYDAMQNGNKVKLLYKERMSNLFGLISESDCYIFGCIIIK